MPIDEESIFAQALSIESTQQRSAYLDDVCTADPELRQRIEALLQSHEEASGVLNPKIAETAALPSALETAGETIGSYKLLQQIGEGGFGVVYMAEQQKPVRRKVALKIIKPGMDTKEVIARFEAERQALALMDHPNIARVFDAGATAAGRPYFAMELVKGVPMIEFCDENNLTNQQRLELFVDVCHAIQHAHQKGIIHRDLKPSNVMVTIHDNQPVPKVIDFGVSKAISQQLTERTLFTAYGQMIGTPVYMSPEQAQMSGLDIDTRSDIYSLGVMLYELLTGTTPLDSERLRKSGYAEMQRLIREEEAPKPSDRLSTQSGDALTKIAKHRGAEPGHLNRQVRGELDWIVMKSLEKDRNRRYETANGFAADVQRFLRNETVVACPPSAAYKLSKFVDRNRRGVMLAGTVMSALLLAVAGLTVGYLRAEKSANEARIAWQNVSEEQQRTEEEKLRAEQQRERAEKQRAVAEQERQAAEAATEKAKAAEREQTESLTDVYTTLGAAAAQRKEKAQAMLWFANAAKIAPDPERERYNRIRARTYSNDMLVPIAAFQHDAVYVGQAEIHASNQYIMTRPLGKDFAKRILDLGEIKIQEILTGKKLALPESWLPLKAATWSPDGRILAVVTREGEFLEVDFATLSVLNRVSSNEEASLLQYSRTGKLIALFGTDVVRVWNSKSQSFVTPDLEHPETVSGVDFSPNEEHLLTSCVDEKARLWALGDSSGEPPVELDHLRGSTHFRQRICQPAIFVGDDRICVSARRGSGDLRTVSIHEPNGKLIKKLSATFNSGYLCNDRNRHLVVKERFNVVFIDLETEEQTRLKMPTDEIQVAVSQANNLLATCGTGRVRLWKLDELELIDSSNAKNKSCNFCKFSPDGQLLCTSERGGLVKVWQRIERNPGKYSVPVSHSFAETSPDGKYFAAVGLSQRSSRLSKLTIREVAKGKKVYERLVSNGIGPWLGVLTDGMFFPSGEAIVVAIADGGLTRGRRPAVHAGRIQIHDWNDLTRPALLSVELASEPRSVSVSPDGLHVVALSADGTVTLVDAKKGDVVDRWQAHPPAFKNNWYANNGEIAFSPDGTKFFTWGTEDFARAWHFAPQSTVDVSQPAQLREPVYQLQHSGRVLDLKFSPDGKHIATSEWDGQRLQVWDSVTGQSVAPPMKHPDWVMGIGFSPNGHQVVTACRDGNARVWDWRSGKTVCPPMTHTNEIHDAAFLQDGKTIVTTCYAGSLGVWETQTGTRLAPPVAVDCRPIRLTVTKNSSHVILGGHANDKGISVVDLDHLFRRDDRSTQDLVAMTEFFTGHRIGSAKPQKLVNDEVVALFGQTRETIHNELGIQEYQSWAAIQKAKQAEESIPMRKKYVETMLEIFDVDHDGRLSKQESTPRLVRSFETYDENSDNRLSKSELLEQVFKVVITNPERARPLMAQIQFDSVDLSKVHPSFQQLHIHFDKDGDKRLSEDEREEMFNRAPFLQVELFMAAVNHPEQMTKASDSDQVQTNAFETLRETQESMRDGVTLLREGSKLSREGQQDQAKQKFREAAAAFEKSDDSTSAPVLRVLGLSYFESDQYKKAIPILEQSLELSNEEHPASSKTPMLWWMLATAYAELGDFEKAREHYNELKRNKPKASIERNPMYQRLHDRLEALISTNESLTDE